MGRIHWTWFHSQSLGCTNRRADFFVNPGNFENLISNRIITKEKLNEDFRNCDAQIPFENIFIFIAIFVSIRTHDRHCQISIPCIVSYIVTSRRLFCHLSHWRLGKSFFFFHLTFHNENLFLGYLFVDQHKPLQACLAKTIARGLWAKMYPNANS